MITKLSFLPASLLKTESAKGGKSFPLTLKVFGPDDDKRAIFDLRYRAFTEIGVIDEREDGLFSDAYDDLATTWNIGAFEGETCIGSLRLTFGNSGRTRPTMPCQEVFLPEIASLQGRGYCKLVEFTRMAVAPGLTNTSFRATLYGSLVRAGMMIAQAGAADYALMSAHPDRTRFYKTMCGFEVIAHADDYPGINAPAVLLGRDFRVLEQRRTSRNPFFNFTAAEVASARAAMRSASISAPSAELALR